ncbi:DNA-binding transcriptional regulator Fis [Thiohalophilus sp.]|uniref:DNA-binding transcriptional regulator Fis n=1 Tax=Thiohalophilus sp. TaxID=3028392 RepID=UPI002ACD8FFD|nr:DNA-binding transcriptional regulator Fis [Thiohalophilus sp.]MDZ7805404.1 DNA-binding transcriptional regulator Fis [Thiohalophilus sp.]
MSEAVAMENAVVTNNNTFDSSQKPLRDCVADAMDNYFRQLEGHPTNDLYKMVLAELEEPLFRAVLQHTGGNQSKASEMLGINRGTLRKKLKQYGLHD